MNQVKRYTFMRDPDLVIRIRDLIMKTLYEAVDQGEKWPVRQIEIALLYCYLEIAEGAAWSDTITANERAALVVHAGADALVKAIHEISVLTDSEVEHRLATLMTRTH